MAGHAVILLGMLLAATSNPLAAQDVIRTEADRVITLSLGSTAVISASDSITRISVASPGIAEPVVIPPREVLINAKSVGATSLLVWGRFQEPRFYTVEVTADVASLQRQIAELFPEAELGVASTVLPGPFSTAQELMSLLPRAEITPGRASYYVRLWTPVAKFVNRTKGNGRIRAATQKATS